MTTYRVQTVSKPYSNRIPETAWITKKITISEQVARRVAGRWSQFYSDGQSWSGHVRIIDGDGVEYQDDPFTGQGCDWGPLLPIGNCRKQ